MCFPGEDLVLFWKITTKIQKKKNNNEVTRENSAMEVAGENLELCWVPPMSPKILTPAFSPACFAPMW